MTIREQIEQAKQKDLLSVEEVSLLTGVAERTIYRKIQVRKIPGLVRFGRIVRFKRVVVLQDWDIGLEREAAHAASHPRPSHS